MNARDKRVSLAAKKRRPLIALAGVAAAVVGGVLLISGAGDAALPIQPGQVARSGVAAGFNLLLITLDTTRADRLGCYGYGPARTPAIDSLLAHGIRFDDAVSSSPMTLPSHATMMTGLYPVHHGARHNGSSILADRHLTLAETLGAQGYDTAAFVSVFVLERRFGLAQGFEVYDFEVSEEGYHFDTVDSNERQADAVTDAALAWLDTQQAAAPAVQPAPFFLWVHYFDPHRPYQSPLASEEEFASRPYDAEIAFVDTQVGRLLETLSGRGLAERTLIALVADHGESMGEHLETTHGYFIYDATIQVGFILSSPGLFNRSYCVNDRVVGLVDLRPTLEDLLGIRSTGPCDGQSLLDDISPTRAIYAETRMPLAIAGWSPLYALRRHTDKYILAPEPEYYDLRADPGELHNLYAARPEGLAALELELARLVADGDGDEDDLGQVSVHAMTEEEAARLRALGYVHSDTLPSSGPRPDPKAMLPVHRQMEQAIRLFDQGRTQEALGWALGALELCESFPLGERTLASIYFRLGRLDEAVEVLRRSAGHAPEFATHVSLARVYLHQRRYRETEQAIAAAAKIYPDDGRVFMLRGDLMGLQDRFAEAIAQYELAIEMDESRAGIRARQKIDRVRSLMARQDGSR